MSQPSENVESALAELLRAEERRKVLRWVERSMKPVARPNGFGYNEGYNEALRDLEKFLLPDP